MSNEENLKNDNEHKKVKNYNINIGIYGLAFIGALVYFIQQATTFWLGVLGFLKAIVWPALLIYKLFELLKL